MKKKVGIVLTLCLLGRVGSYNLLNVGATDYEAEAGFVSEETAPESNVAEGQDEFLEEQETAGNTDDFIGETTEAEEPDTEEQDVFSKENLTEPDIGLETSEQLQEGAVLEGNCGKDGTNLTWKLEEDGTLRIIGNGAMADWEDENSVPWSEVKDKILKIVIDDSVTTIGSFAFYNCTQATDVQMPENLEYVGSFSFFNCTGVAAVTIG